ncbi:aminodeoxychorismate synthase component 1 [Natrialba magadii ATCC 43099]|uniref:anthranilate synthase n=1 Tax=Natrialba magadii (strain ATCC 43099 / DSM 3394 / CCM 3739 / CIP 104546 / IAM 13178 / JCM 8861 / NBRC 102185 / NCIMB 2190 / MS3) TaxID=547559 RepID=D3SZT6_NATMM|nr:anthranilate synthase component I family protein [Natrialba magadii]ADD06346.1 aminodeoxychorismate synthase component 1 [Natrialba magadii ATCC 43099]ELY31220.1 para-aminobenzoate synthase component I [Natrialba magadii ATCC 43099]
MSEPRVVTSFESFRAALESADTESGRSDGTTRGPIRVPVEVTVTAEDPFQAYCRARGARTGDASEDDTHGAFLETTGGQPGWGYFGVDPVDRLQAAPEAVTRWDAQDDDRNVGSSAPTLAALEGLLESDRLARGDCSVPYPCGVIGWLSYGIARELEDLPESAVDDRGLPQLEVATYDRLVSWEEPIEGDEVTLRITACPRVGGAPSSQSPTSPAALATDPVYSRDDLEAAYEHGRDRALEVAQRVQDGDSAIGEPPVDTTEATFESACGREAFAERVRRVKEYIRDGDTFQANISQRLVAPAAVHPVAAYDALRGVNPAPYSCLLEFRAADLVSASPELLLEREVAHTSTADGRHGSRERATDYVRTEPIAGTRPRGETPEQDVELEADLLADEKERAEHAMLVDLERNDLGKVCKYGTVEVSEYRRVDRYAEVMHLVSDVTGRLRADETLADAIAAVFPGGTITGAPKPRTMEIIDELESTRRGPYTGSVGIFGFDGRATLNIVIRTLVRQDAEYHLRVGAGIVHDSEPELEYDETLAKARALVNAVDDALGERAEMGVSGDGERGGASENGERGGASGEGDEMNGGGPDE